MIRVTQCSRRIQLEVDRRADADRDRHQAVIPITQMLPMIAGLKSGRLRKARREVDQEVDAQARQPRRSSTW